MYSTTRYSYATVGSEDIELAEGMELSDAMRNALQRGLVADESNRDGREQAEVEQGLVQADGVTGHDDDVAGRAGVSCCGADEGEYFNE
jgi:hypothetical protein